MATLIGLLLGLSGVGFGVALAIGGPVAGFGAFFGLAVAFYVLTDLMGGLYVMLAVVALLPFATLPFKIAVTPTFIDMALAAFMVVYLFQWMTGKRSRPRFLTVHWLMIGFAGFTLFAFVAGLSHGLLTTSVLRKFVELLISIGAAVILVDVIRDTATLRRVSLVILVMGAAQALIGIGLVVINAQTAERLLNTLGRFGYPVGGVIRYVEENPDLAERAIGTWVDPNAYGGFLVLIGALGSANILAEKPLLNSRLIGVILWLPVIVVLLLTQSRGALVGLAAAAAVVAVLRYRWLIPVGIVAAAVFLIVPFTQNYVTRFVAGLNNQDLATQMRFGEYKDALILIGRNPIIGVGFVGTPDRDTYLGVSSLYLMIAENTGLVGLGIFAATMLAIVVFGLGRRRRINANPLLANLWLGYTAGLCGALVSGIFDHFYFDVEFSGAALMFWLFAGLALVAAHLAQEDSKQIMEIR